MIAYNRSVATTTARAHADLFRLLGDEDRLRLLALCDAEELTVGELATLLRQSQPQVTRKTQPLRDAGLLGERRDGTRILLRAEAKDNPIVLAALRAGNDLCLAEGRLARIPKIVARREETARKLFADGAADTSPIPNVSVEPFLPLLSALLPGHHLAVDVGCGDGLLQFRRFVRPMDDGDTDARAEVCGLDDQARVGQVAREGLQLRDHG